MSSFLCDKCGASCIDTPRGYIAGCKHYPSDFKRTDVTSLVVDIGMKNMLRGLLALTHEDSKVTKNLKFNLLKTYEQYIDDLKNS